MAVIRTEGLVKDYSKQVRALKGVSIQVEKGEIYGLLGRNGAGKTTLVKILLGIVKPTAGEAELLGMRAGTVAVRGRLGFLPEDHRFPEYHTGWSLLDFYGALLGLPRGERRRRIPEMLELVGIAHRQHAKVRTYSKGMKQRLGIAQALLHDPEVLFLDEPTDGVDPVGRREIRELLQRLRDRKKTIFLNSHLLGEVEMITDRVGIMELGSIVKEGDVDSLTRQGGRFLLGLARDQVFPLEDLLARGFQVHPGKDGLVELVVDEDHGIDAVIDYLREHGLQIRHLVEKRITLEDIFMATVDRKAAES